MNYTTEMEKVVVEAQSGSATLEIGKAFLSEKPGFVTVKTPWESFEVEIPEAPAPGFESEFGVIPAGETKRNGVSREMAGIKVYFSFKHTLITPITAGRWEEWTIVDHGSKVEFETHKWSVDVPIRWEELGTRKEYQVLSTKSLRFFDKDGDSCMSDSEERIFSERLAFVASQLGLPYPDFGNKREAVCPLRKIKTAGLTGVPLDFVIEKDEVQLVFGGKKLPLHAVSPRKTVLVQKDRKGHSLEEIQFNNNKLALFYSEEEDA